MIKMLAKLAVLFSMLVAVPVLAQTGSCNTSVCNAASASPTDVLNALPSPGNTNATVVVNVPTSTATWTSGITYTVPSGVTNLTIQGNTVVTCTGTDGTSGYSCPATDNTVFIDSYASNTPLIVLSLGSSSTYFRITGFTFAGGSTSYSKYDGVIEVLSGNSQNVRYDHNHTTFSTYSPSSTEAVALRTYAPIAGVVDHNNFDLGPDTQYSFGISNFGAYNDTIGNGDGTWANPTPWGQYTGVMYVESNVASGGEINDCGNAGSMVIRYNTFSDMTAGVQTHGTKTPAGPQRGCRSLEVYHNYFTHPGGGSTADAAIGTKIGPVMIWGNTLAAGYYRFFAASTDRSGGDSAAETNTPNGWGYCNTVTPSSGGWGSGNPANGVGSSWDGNQPSITYGNPCLDAVGRGQTVQHLNGANFSPTVSSGRLNSSTGTIAWPQQYLEPVYLFDNTVSPASGINAALRDLTTLPNQDVYADCNGYSSTYGGWNGSSYGGTYAGCSSFNGTVGTGFGLHSALPSTCTPGPGGTYFTSPTGSYGPLYFATNDNGGLGEGYACTSANTWTPIYGPSAFPHPLVSGTPTFTWTPTIVGSGSLTGTNCGSGSKTSGITIGPCTAVPASGYAFTAWSLDSGNAACSGSTNPCPSFTITSNSGTTATFTSTGPPQVVAPTFNPAGGPFSAAQFVTISSTTSGSTCTYTTDISTPTSSSTQFIYSLYVAQTVTLKAMCYETGYTNSTVSSATYTLPVFQTAFSISAIASLEATNPFPNPNRSIAVEWDNVLTTPASDCNTYSWSALDAWIAQSASNGVDNLYTFSHVPQCANGTTNQANPPTDITSGDTFFKNFVTAFWNHECGLSSPPSTPVPASSCNDVRYVETWNEDNTDLYWTDTYAHKAIMDNDLAHITYEYCSDCIVIFGSVSAGGSGSHTNGESGYYDVAALEEATAWAALSPFYAPRAASIHDYWSRDNIAPPPFPTTLASNSDATCPGTSNASCYVTTMTEFSRYQGSAVLQNSAISSWASMLPMVGTEGGYGLKSNLCPSTDDLCIAGIAQHMAAVASQHPKFDLLYASNTCTIPNDWGCYWNNGTSLELAPINRMISWFGTYSVTGTSLTSTAITGGNKWTLQLAGGTAEIDFCDAWWPSTCTTTTGFDTQTTLDGTTSATGGSVTLSQKPTLLFSSTSHTLSTTVVGLGTITGCAGSYSVGTPYSCTVTPASGNVLVSVTGCGGSGTTTYAGTMPGSNCTVTATFATLGPPTLLTGHVGLTSHVSN